MSEKVKLLNCYQDLERAAKSLYLNSRGNNHLVFVIHALKILEGTKSNKGRLAYTKLKKLKLKMDRREITPEKMADDLLTTGILFKP